MYLTLEVVSPQAVSLGAQRRQVVGVKGLTIGRVPGNDWVIPDPYVSKQHARIVYVNGGFVVEGLGKNPIAIAKRDNAIPGRQPYVLKNGDHLFIDQYDIVVSIFQGEPPQAVPPAASEDPFGIVDADALPPAHDPLIPDVWDGGSGAAASDTARHLDPLVALGGNARPEPELPPVNLQPDSPLRDPFAPPSVRAAPPAVPPSAIPEGWDRDFDQPSPRGESNAGIPANWDRSRATPPPPQPSAPSPQPIAPARPAPSRAQSAAPQRSRPAPEPQSVRPAPRPPAPQPPRPSAPRTAALAAPPAVPAPAPARPVAVSAPAPSAGVSADPAASFKELLRGAGLSERDLTPEMMRELGQVLRIVVQGVLDVLQARTEIKSQFRLPLTRLQEKENNPLKLSPNVESALHTLLVHRNPGYLTTVPAFEEAFTDIRNHQVALLEGVREAFKSMLEAFDPEELQKEFGAHTKRGGPLSGVLGAKSKYWDLYVERYSALGRDDDDTFRRLFGDVFAQAYERQLERLKSLAKRNKN